jgi:hypothetical protein
VPGREKRSSSYPNILKSLPLLDLYDFYILL